MAKKSNHKLKIVYIMQILLEQTDEEHGITMRELTEHLERYGVFAERKSIYSDLEQLKEYGLDLVMEHQKQTYYYRVVSREFEQAELKMLVDAVQSARFIPEPKARMLIQKIGRLGSIYQAKQLCSQRKGFEVSKSCNHKIFYTIDQLSDAIAKKRQIRFQYASWCGTKHMELKHGGKIYEVSPWQLIWENGFYYLIGYDQCAEKRKHFRVDKIRSLQTTKKKCEKQAMDAFEDIGAYTRKRFQMFDGKVQTVDLEVEAPLLGVMMDRFGVDAFFHEAEDGIFHVVADVAISDVFFGWLFGLGKGVRLVGPEAVMKQLQERIRTLCGQYGMQEKDWKA